MKILTLNIIIANELKNMIEQEHLKEGDKLPSERELCEKLNVQRLTLRSGLRILLQEGIIVSKQRSGYFVNKPRIEKSVFRFESTSEAIIGQGLKMEVRTLHVGKKEIDKRLSSKLKLPLGTEIYFLQRLRLVENEPVSLDTDYIPAIYVPNLEQHDTDHHPLYEIMATNYGIQADDFTAEVLKVEPGTRMVYQQGLTYDINDRLIEYSEIIMKMDRFVYVN